MHNIDIFCKCSSIGLKENCNILITAKAMFDLVSSMMYVYCTRLCEVDKAIYEIIISFKFP